MIIGTNPNGTAQFAVVSEKDLLETLIFINRGIL